MSNFFNYNGKIYREGTPVVTADSRGLRYGDGLFETLKIKDGKIVFAEEHLLRLWNGMNVLQFEIPSHFTAETLMQQLLALATKNGHQKSVRARLMVFRSDGGLYDAKNHLPNYILQTFPLSADAERWNSNGLTLGIYNEAKKNCDLFSNLKHNNYLPFAMAALYAQQHKWNDAILLNNHGRVCESTIANIFFIKKEVVYTPALSEGCVAGIMRHFLIDKIKEIGFEVQEKAIAIEGLMDADEVFLSNSIYDMRWVQSIDGKEFGNRVAHKIHASIF